MSINPVILKISAVAAAVLVVSCTALVVVTGNHSDPVVTPDSDTEASPYYDDEEHDVTQHTFYYLGSGSITMYGNTLYYSDDYFDYSGKEYNTHLATASCAVSMSVYYRDGLKYLGVMNLMKDMGFENVCEYGYYTGTSYDTIAVVIGEKETDDGTLICIAVRGFGYGQEWKGNFLVGTEGDHEGFSIAADVLLSYMRSYVQDNGLTGDSKLWITGYSRGAAVANAAAGKICTAIEAGSEEELTGLRFTTDGIYAYTFESPCTAYDDGRDIHGDAYKGIWNIIDTVDYIPNLLFPEYGLERYGTDVFLPDPYSDGYEEKKDSMLLYYDSLENRAGLGEYSADCFSAGSSGIATQTEFQSMFNKALDESIGGRTSYSETIVPELNTLTPTLITKCGDKLGELIGKMYSYDQETMIDAAFMIINGDISGAVDSLHECFVKTIMEYGISEKKAEKSFASVKTIAGTLDDLGKDNSKLLFILAENIMSLTQAHYPEIEYAWLMSQDPYYMTAE